MCLPSCVSVHPCAYLVPEEIRETLLEPLELELRWFVSHHEDAGQSRILGKNRSFPAFPKTLFLWEV